MARRAQRMNSSRPEGPPTGSWGPEGPLTSSIRYLELSGSIVDRSGCQVCKWKQFRRLVGSFKLPASPPPNHMQGWSLLHTWLSGMFWVALSSSWAFGCWPGCACLWLCSAFPLWIFRAEQQRHHQRAETFQGAPHHFPQCWAFVRSCFSSD